MVKLSAWSLGFLAIVGLAGGWLLAGRMLRPLQEITAAARRAASGSLDHRVGLTGIRDEFTDLSDTFDEMLDRLQASFEQYRRFASNASHELRTPHAVMKTMLEVAQADPEHQDVPELVKRLAETNQRGIDIVETLLSLTALNNREIELDPVDLAAEQVRTFVEPFAKRRYGAGHGLGLALVDRIVEVHQGRLELTPNPDRRPDRNRCPARGRPRRLTRQAVGPVQG